MLSTTCGKTRSGGAAISIVCSFRCRGRSLGAFVRRAAHLLSRGLALLVDSTAHRLELVGGRRARRRRGPLLGLGRRRLRAEEAVPEEARGPSAARRPRTARRPAPGPPPAGPRRASREAPAGGPRAPARSEGATGGPRRRRPPRREAPRLRMRHFGSQWRLFHDEEARGKRARSLYSDDFLPRPAPPLPERRSRARPLQTVGRRNREL